LDFKAPRFKEHPLPILHPQLGDVFTLRLPGAAMTFVFAPPALLFYFTAPDTELAFTPAVEQVSFLGLF
jgi:hypothetical protein